MLSNIGILRAGVVVTTMAMATAVQAGDTRAAAPAKNKAANAVRAADRDIKESILHSKIRLALLKSLKGADSLRIDMTVKGTTVTLSGEVEDRASEKMASEVAKSVEGVSAVHSTITHNPKAPHQANLESRVKDAVLVTEIKLRLMQEIGGSAVGLTVTATDGAVSLRGNLPDAATRTRAVDKVKEIAGVLRVEDLLTTP